MKPGSMFSIAAVLALLLCLAGVEAIGAQESGENRDPEQPRGLILESIEIEGNSRTGRDRVLDRLDLKPGEPIDPATLQEAVATLRQAQLFREVEVHTRPGSEPGHVVAVFQVKENRPHFRIGAGYEDLSGWYLIPIELAADNLTGNGETLRLSTRFGFRVAGIVLDLRSSPAYLRKTVWGVRLRAESKDRVYFYEGTEVNQKVAGTGIDLSLDFPIAQQLTFGTKLSFETIEPDSGATVHRDRDVLGRTRGQDIPYFLLPPGIQEDLGRRNQTRMALSLTGDGRRGSNLLTRGLRGRLQGEGIYSKDGSFLSLIADGRGYAPVGSRAMLAGRLYAGAVTDEAPFYERFYLGGLYTVRGYPFGGLSPPDGSLQMVTGSAELRTALVGDPGKPRVTGILFLDAGWAGSHDPFRTEDISLGIGYGLRVGIPWIQQLGLDVGIPLSPSAIENSFLVNMSLEWTF
jgi:outer membrane protein insertion porin family